MKTQQKTWMTHLRKSPREQRKNTKARKKKEERKKNRANKFKSSNI